MKLNLDLLEARAVPATLFLKGGAGADTFLISDYGGGIVQVVANGLVTTHKSIDSIEGNFQGGNDVVTIVYTGPHPDHVSKDKFHLGDGNDQLTFLVPAGTPWGSVNGTDNTFTGGAGDDKFSIVIGSPQFPAPLDVGGDVRNLISGDAGNDSVWVDINCVQFRGAAQFDFKMGSGDDFFDCEQYKVGHNYEYALNFLGEGGDDVVNYLAQKVLGDGDFDARIDVGSGNNRVISRLEELIQNYHRMDFTAISGEGADYQELHASEIRSADGGIRQETGRGPDQLIAELAHCYMPLGYTALTEGDNDVAVVDVIQDANMPFDALVDLGAGDDTALVRTLLQLPEVDQPIVSQTVSLLGGSGRDNLFTQSSFAFTDGPELQWHFKQHFKYQLLVDAGDGQDFVDVRGDYFGPASDFIGEVRVDVRGGRGNDFLRVMWADSPNVDFRGLLDGGDGIDVGITTSNIAKRNCEQ